LRTPTKFGDENTKKNHSVATERYRRNNIASLLITDGSVISEYKGKEEIIFQAYKERLGSCDQPQMLFDLADLIQPAPGLEDLSIRLTKQEIDAVVQNMPLDKAPGPNGFNGQFLKSYWHIIKEDIY
jgi:hypothetical protein